MDLQRRSRVSNRRGTRSSGKYSPLDLLKKILLLASVSGLLSLNVPQAANGTAQAIIVYGKIPRGQAVAAGTYADTVIITLSY